MNPFDLKSVLLAKHAQHVAMVHFPIALTFASVLLICCRCASRASLCFARRTTP